MLKAGIGRMSLICVSNLCLIATDFTDNAGVKRVEGRHWKDVSNLCL